jgi:hypothetical protein
VIAFAQRTAGNETPKPLINTTTSSYSGGVIPEGEPLITEAIAMPPQGPTAELGYILSYQDCVRHGADLSGGKLGGKPTG